MCLQLYVYIYLCFIARAWTWTLSVLKLFAHNSPVSGVKQMERQRKYKLDSEMENAFLFEMIIPPLPPNGSTNKLLLHFRQLLLI